MVNEQSGEQAGNEFEPGYHERHVDAGDIWDDELKGYRQPTDEEIVANLVWMRSMGEDSFIPWSSVIDTLGPRATELLNAYDEEKRFEDDLDHHLDGDSWDDELQQWLPRETDLDAELYEASLREALPLPTGTSNSLTESAEQYAMWRAAAVAIVSGKPVFEEAVPQAAAQPSAVDLARMGFAKPASAAPAYPAPKSGRHVGSAINEEADRSVER